MKSTERAGKASQVALLLVLVLLWHGLETVGVLAPSAGGC